MSCLARSYALWQSAPVMASMASEYTCALDMWRVDLSCHCPDFTNGCLAGVTEIAAAHSSEPTLNSPEDTCSHQAPCLVPQDSEHSSAFWHIASLEAGLSLCSSAAAAHQLPEKSADEQDFSFLDLSFSDSGAAQYLLKHAPVEVTAGVLMGSGAAQQLCSTQAEATQQGATQPVLQQWPDDFKTALATPASTADQSVHANAAISPATGTSVAPNSAASTSSLSAIAAPLEVSTHHTQPCSTAEAISTKPDQARSAAGLPQHSLAAYQALTAAVGAVNLVVGDLCSCADEVNADGNRTAYQGSSAEGAGVMESEYGAAYRAGVLWECAVALSCLKPGKPSLKCRRIFSAPSQLSFACLM